MGPKMEKYPLIEKGKFKLLASKIAGKSNFQRELQTTGARKQGSAPLLNHPRESGITGVVGNKLVPLVVFKLST